MDRDEAAKVISVTAALIYVADATAGRPEKTLDEYVEIAGRVLKRASEFEFWETTGE